MLAIDCGNTRLKWGFYQDGKRQASGAAGLNEIDAAFAAISAKLHGAASRVLIANVAGEAVGAQLLSAAESRLGVPAEFARVQQSAGGIECGYQDPATLGVDRWLAMIAARSFCTGSFVLVGAGTAVTCDAVDQDGRHLGGLIWPGDPLMRKALADNTAAIAYVPSQTERVSGTALFGRSTEAAVAAGSWTALAAAVDRAFATAAEALSGQPRLVLTGGDAEQLAGWLASAGEVRADLVLDGLAVLAAAAETIA